MSVSHTTRVVRFHQPGAPDVLVVDELALPPPGPGEARVRHRAIGVNFIDCYHRSGLYPLPLPGVVGVEAVGVVVDVGAGVTRVKAGDRVAYKTKGPGAYADERNVDADRLVVVPDGLGDAAVAAAYVKGLTAEYLACRLHNARAGETAVVTAAAGGVGQLLVRLLLSRGVRVIAQVGRPEKVDVVVGCGVDRADVVVGHVDVGAAVRARVADGVDVAYDSVGHDTFPSLLDGVRRRGLFVSFGNASGPVPPFAPALLSQKGSLFFTRPALHDWVHDVAEQDAASAHVFSLLREGTLHLPVQQTLPLADAARAHAMLEARQTQGALVLLP